MLNHQSFTGIHWFKPLAIVVAALLTSTTVSAQEAASLDEQLQEAVDQYAMQESHEKDLSTIKSLLSKGAHPHGIADDPESAMFMTGMTPLASAIYYDAPDLVALFLKQKVDLSIPVNDASGETLLMFALNNVRDEKPKAEEIKIVKLLLDAGAEPNTIAQGGSNSPLNAAAEGGSSKYPHPELVELLLKNGADATQTLAGGFTPLMGSAASSLETLKLLINAGADPYAVSDTGATPLHFVCKRAFDKKGTPDPEAAERIKLLLKPGTSIDHLYEQKRPHPVGTPLLENIAYNENPDCISALIAAGANTNAPAYPDSYTAHDPKLKGVTVKQEILENAKISDRYIDAKSLEIIKKASDKK